MVLCGNRLITHIYRCVAAFKNGELERPQVAIRYPYNKLSPAWIRYTFMHCTYVYMEYVVRPPA